MGGVWGWRTLQPGRHRDTGMVAAGRLVLAWGEANPHGNPYHGWSPYSNLAAARRRPILAGATRTETHAPWPP
jgi:hypothetical protein